MSDSSLAPDFYLFPALAENPVLCLLCRLRQGGEVLRRELYPPLAEFAGTRAYTEETVREYAVRAMLRNPPAFWRAASMEAYLLQQDAALLFELFFCAGWEAICENKGLLPFPAGPAESAPGEEPYKKTIVDMVNAKDAQTLCRLTGEFFERYSGEEEAMFRAFRWNGRLEGIADADPVSFAGLHGLEQQKSELIKNTWAFASGLAANDVLLIGGSGTGKSSCVKAALNHCAPLGLKLAEIHNRDLGQLPKLIEHLSLKKQRYIVFIDDLSFENADKNYLALKVSLDGQVARRPSNVLVYATSNRRHLIKETWKDRGEDPEIHENDTMSEKLSLSERFGLRLYFPTLIQKEYLAIVRMLVEQQGMEYTAEIGKAAAAWAGANNGWSGRSARQFVRGYAAGS